MPAPDGVRWERLKRVFGDALDLPVSSRAAFVAAECRDDEALRREIEALLHSDSEAGGFCETPAAGLLAGVEGMEPPPVRRLEPSSRLGVYEITSFLSAGGMGEVYRARDTRLGREVAIKTVSVELGGPAARARLLREAQHASILSHPNICTIYEAGEVDALPFIVMEFVEGRPLNEVVRERPLPVPQGVAYALQIASALDHAHGRGIIHRDVKSSNIIITPDGRPIVLDFGLARRLPEGEGAVTETAAGAYATVAGTLGYMAPELLLGRRADTRTDVWSLGVLLHEMLTGTLPFSGRTAFGTSSAIIGEPPRPLPRSIPIAIRLVIDRCLRKDPAERYQRACEVASALEAARHRPRWSLATALVARRPRLAVAAGVLALVAAVGVAGGDRVRGVLTGNRAAVTTLALLPFANDDGGAADDYYVDGVTEALIHELGALKDIRVLSRGSTARYRGRGIVPAAAALDLRASVVLQGTVRRASGLVAIDAKLTDAATGRVLWSDRFERGARDVLALQADIVRQVAQAVHATMGPEARDRLTLVRAVNPDVYEAYLKGRYYWNQRTPESLHLAVQQFDRSIALDPTYAPAHAALADCYNQLGTVMVGSGSPLEYRPRATAAAIRALQIDANSAEAHATLGYVKHYDLEWEESERQLRRAIELNPSYALARVWYANMLMSRRRLDEALEQIYMARDLDPFSLVVNTNVGWVLTAAGRNDDAVAHLRQTLTLDPQYPQAHMRLGAALFNVGRTEEAIAEYRKVVEITGRSPFTLSALATAYARTGQREAAGALLGELLEMSGRRYVSPTAISQVYIALGDIATAMTYLERALDERTNAVAYLAVESTYDSMRADPRFKALLARARLD